MTTSCPFCGATLNLAYCVVCGRQSNVSMNKMGSLKTIARNTDATQRLDNPFELEKRKRKEIFQRTKRTGEYLVKAISSGLLIAVLFLIITNQATDLFQMQAAVSPWMKSHRLVFPPAIKVNIDNIKDSVNHAVPPSLINRKQKPAGDKHKHKAENPRNKVIK